MATLRENIRYYKQAIRESLATTFANIHYYRVACLRQVTLFATLSFHFIYMHFVALTQRVNNAYHFIIRYLRPLPAWLLTHLVQGLQALFSGIYAATRNLFIILRALPGYSWQFILSSFRILTNVLLNTYQLLCQLGQATLNAVRNGLSFLARNFFPALSGTWHLLKRICLNIVDDIRHLPRYLYQAGIVATEILRILLQASLDLIKTIVNVFRPVLSFMIRKIFTALLNVVVFILGFIAALGDITLNLIGAALRNTVGRLVPTSATPHRAAVSCENEIPKTTPSYTPSFQGSHLNRVNDETTDNEAKKRPSLAV